MATDPDDQNGDWTFADTVAGAWFVILVVGLAGSAIILALRLPIVGTVQAETMVVNVLQPLAYAMGAILVVISYISARELFGRKTTDSAIANVLDVLRESGAASELRDQLEKERNRNND